MRGQKLKVMLSHLAETAHALVLTKIWTRPCSWSLKLSAELPQSHRNPHNSASILTVHSYVLVIAQFELLEPVARPRRLCDYDYTCFS